MWDAWRRVLFLGPSDFNDTYCDGAILVDQEDIDDPLRRTEVVVGHEGLTQKLTLDEYVTEVFGIESIGKVSVLHVLDKYASKYGHV